jgi:23S rRNA pseudouridine1911/1915/1917 synthase
VIGDKVYGKSALDKRLDPIPARQMLHAWKLKLYHPVTSKIMEFTAPIPTDMQAYIIA